MKPARIYRGDSWERSWVIKTAAGTPIDLTGASARLQVRTTGGALVLAVTSSDAALTITPLSGRIDLAVPYADTEGLAAGSYRFDLEVTYADGRRRTYEANTLTILEDVSRG